MNLSLSEIQDARQVLRKILPPSPLIHNAWLSDAYGCEIHLKLENMQPIGSFKIRGAPYRVSRLSAAERRSGVVAASAGNHAQGVAWGARMYRTRALIVMPRIAPLTKIQNTRALGAEILMEGDTFDEAMAAARAIARKKGRVFIPAFEDRSVIAGQGTVGLELLEQLPDVDVVIGSVGGGGLMGGVGTVLKELRPQARVIGCQATGASSMVRSVLKGRAVTLDRAETFADGIAIGEARESMRKLLVETVDQLLDADDESIASAVLTLLEKAKVVAEGAGALPLAALERLRKQVAGKKVVLIISGGNIDVNLLSRIIDRGLIRAGRRLRVNVLISDRTGSLARLTDLIARQGASVLQVIHDRNEPSTAIDQTEVLLTLETRGQEHTDQVVKALKEHVIRLELAH